MRFLSAVFLHLLLGTILPTCSHAQVLIRFSENEYAHEVVQAGDSTWLALDSGAYRIEGNSTVRVLGGLQITKIIEVGDRTWLGTERGIFRAEGRGARLILEEEIGSIRITDIEVFHDKIWIGTQRGLFRIDGENSARLLLKEPIHFMKMIDDKIWVGTRRSVYMFDATGSREEVLTDKWLVSDVVKAGDQIWFITNRDLGLYGPSLRTQNSGIDEYPPGYDVISIANIEGNVWFATTRGMYRDSGSSLERVDIRELHEPINTISVISGNIWLGSTEKAYQEHRGRFIPVPALGDELNIKGIREINGQIWMWASTGAYRYDEDVSIDISTNAQTIFSGIYFLSKNELRMVASYTRRGRDPYSDRISGNFYVAVQEDRQRLEDDILNLRFTPEFSSKRIEGIGFKRLYLAARDEFGNLGRTTIDVVVLPPILVSTLSIGLVWCSLFLAIIALAPSSHLAMSLLMSRKMRSFFPGLAPVLLATSAVRKYILRRYSRVLLSSEDFSGWDLEEKMRPLPNIEYISSKLSTKRRILLLGEASLTRRFLRWFVWYLSAGKVNDIGPNKYIPVFIRLELYGQSMESIEVGLASQLEKYGGVLDRDLAIGFLRTGGFVFLLDGLGYLDEVGKKAIAQFVDFYTRGNMIAIGSTEECRLLREDMVVIPLPATAEYVPTSQLSDRIARIESLVGPQALTNYEGFACARVEEKESGLPVTQEGDAIVITTGVTYELIVHLTTEKPTYYFSRPVSIRDGHESNEVNFVITPDSDVIEFSPRSIPLSSRPEEPTPEGRFLFSVEYKKEPQNIWIDISQKNRLIQVITLKIRHVSE